MHTVRSHVRLPLLLVAVLCSHPAEFAATLYRRLDLDVANDQRLRTFIRDALPVNELI
jgi:hypothetical protein